MIVEFIGGPKDGELHEVPELVHELVVPMSDLRRVYVATDGNRPLEIRTGLYRYTGGRDYRWIGER